MEKEINYPIFVFENIHDDDILGGQIEGMYASIESLNIGIEPWMVNENYFTAYDAQGRLLNLSVEWKKIEEKGLLFGRNLVNREFIKISISDEPIIKSELLKKFLQINLQEIIVYIKKTLEKNKLEYNKLNLKAGLFQKLKTIIANKYKNKSIDIEIDQKEFINLVFKNNKNNKNNKDNNIMLKSSFLNQLILNFANNILQDNLIHKMELIDLVKLAQNVWIL